MYIEKKMKRAIILMCVFMLIVWTMTGCGAEKDKQTNEKSSKQVLNIGIQPAVGFLPLYIMKDNKLLEKALDEAGYSVNVTYTEYESGPPENEAFAAGLVDIGVMGNVPALSGIAAGQDRKIIGIAYNGAATEAIIVPKNSDIKKVSDLKGKKIGLVIGSIAQNLVANVFEKNKLNFNDVEFINLSAGEQQQALINGQVDAVATWEPTISKLTADGNNVVLADGTGVFLGENPIIARGEYIDKHHEIVQIFINVYKEAVKLLDSDTENYAKTYSDYFGIEENIISLALDNANEPIEINDKDVEDLQKTADFLKNEDLVANNINVKEYVDFSFGDK